MKKWLKISLISIGSLIALCFLFSVITISIILSPKRLTNIVNKEAPKLISCDFSLAKADLTFFKTFPQVGVEIHDLTLINPMEGAPSDTLLDVNECIAVVNIRELLKNQNIITKKVFLKNGNAHIFINKRGHTNFDVWKLKSEDTATSEFNYDLDLHKIKVQNLNVNYLDLKSLLSANVHHLDLNARGKWQNECANGKMKMTTGKLDFATLDSTATALGYDQLKLQFDGELAHLNALNGALKLNIEDANFKMGADAYLQNTDLALNTNVSASLSDQYLKIKNTDLQLDNYALQLNGTAKRAPVTDDLYVDVHYQTDRWPLKEVLALIPRAIIGDALEGLDMDGKIRLAGDVKGYCSSNALPLITANVEVNDGTFVKDDLPLAFQKINTKCGLNLDLNGSTDLNIKNLSCYSGRNQLTAKGIIRDLLGRMLFDMDISGDLHLADFKQLLPENLTTVSGNAQAAVKIKCDLEQLSNVALDEMVASGNFQFHNLTIIYDDSLSLSSPAINVALRFPVEDNTYNIGEWAEAKIDAAQLKAGKLGLANLNATDVHLDAFVNNLMDSSLQLMLGTTFSFANLSGEMDTLDVLLQQPNGTFVMRGSDNLSLSYNGKSLLAHVGKNQTARAANLQLSAQTDYQPNEQNLFMRWNPAAKVNLSNGEYFTTQLPYPVQIDYLNADLTVNKFVLNKCQAQFGDSDLGLEGTILDIDHFLKGEKLLQGDLNLASNFINVNQIMDVIDGFGNSDTLEVEEESTTADPFMVPKNVLVNLHTNINKALFEDAEIRNVGGNVSIHNGILVLDQMGLTSDAARIQLTAMYKSPRRNNLLLGLDFHLLDVKIADLINMIPAVDTVLPMLKNFAGNAEFHFAISTNLDANYNLKYSTLRGAAAISGKDLVVLDHETYKKISKLLLFNKKTTNKIDSLSAEMTIFKNEVDVYPFAVSIDKYQAILSGRHNLDMTYDYNITLAKPVRLGLEIEGKDKLTFRLTKPKYAKLYNPKRQGVLEQNTLTLKNQIRKALEANVKPVNDGNN